MFAPAEIDTAGYCKHADRWHEGIPDFVSSSPKRHYCADVHTEEPGCRSEERLPGEGEGETAHVAKETSGLGRRQLQHHMVLAASSRCPATQGSATLL